MPQLKVSSKNELIHIDNKQARELTLKKWGRDGNNPTANPKDLIILKDGSRFSVGDIRNIFPDDRIEINNTFSLETTKIRERCLKRQSEVRNWQPLQKSERMLKTYCYLIYRAKGNKGKAKDVMFEDPLYSNLMKVLMEYFENNPSEHYAPKEVYENIIPSNFIETTNILGWRTLGQKLN